MDAPLVHISGHSTTTWTEFCHFFSQLKPSQLVATNMQLIRSSPNAPTLWSQVWINETYNFGYTQPFGTLKDQNERNILTNLIKVKWLKKSVINIKKNIIILPKWVCLMTASEYRKIELIKFGYSETAEIFYPSSTFHTIRKCSKMDGQKYIPFFAFKWW